ncbi:uncharacterized protein LOC135808482 [Sycon ciliatum]|uniref:uncharacterized protein LOC135808482 n=1 Tax=Sycon ciliatum TaxID=27933 RepID=UPI0031F6FB6C
MAAGGGRDGEQLLEELRAGYLRLKDSPTPIRDGQPHLVPFCETLENILRVGLKQPGSILRVTRRDYWDWIEVLPTTSGCNVKKNPLLTEAVDSVRKSPVLKTPQGRGRCFLRMALVQKLVPIPVEHLRKNPKLLSYWYSKDSIIHHEELASQLVHILFEVTEIDFELTERASFLDETWIIPEYVSVELEPCERLGLKLVHMRNRVLVDGLVKGSIVEKCGIESGDIVDELNDVRLFGVKVGQAQNLVSRHRGMITMVIVKSRMKDGTPFAPCQLRQAQVEMQRLQRAKDGTSKSGSNSSDSPSSPKDVLDVLRFDVVMLGVAAIDNPVEDGSIDDAIHDVLEGTGKPEAVVLSLERAHLLLYKNDNNSTPLHSFPLSEVAACARGVVHRTCFGFATGDCRAEDLDGFIFETSSDTKAKLVVQAMVSAFKRSTWFVPVPPPNPAEALPRSLSPMSGPRSAEAATSDRRRQPSTSSSSRSSSRVRSFSSSPERSARHHQYASTSQEDPPPAIDSPCITYNRSRSAKPSIGEASSAAISVSSEHLSDPILRRSWDQSFYGEADEDEFPDESTEEIDAAFHDPTSTPPSIAHAADGTVYSDFEVISEGDSPLGANTQQSYSDRAECPKTESPETVRQAHISPS